MTMQANMQKKFFMFFTDKVGHGKIQVELLSSLLNITKDGVYRRMRGDTAMSFNEICILVRHFNLSMDEFFGYQTNSVLFKHKRNYNIKEYLEFHGKLVKKLNEADHCQMTTMCRDMPLSYLFLHNDLWMFWGYFFARLIWDVPFVKDVRFSVEHVEKLVETEHISLDDFKNIPGNFSGISTIEFWSFNSFSGFFSKIKYCWDSGLFENKDVALELCRKCKLMIAHVEKQAETGRRNIDNMEAPAIPCEMYLTEAINLEYAVLMNFDDELVYIVNSNLGEYLVSYDQSYCRHMVAYNDILVKKSSLISVTNEQKRNLLFGHFYKELQKLERYINLH